MSNIYDDLTDDELLEFATPTVQNDTGVSFDDDLLFNSAKIDESDSIDTKTGAPIGIRAQVNAAQREEDRLITLQRFYPDAKPVEVFDPENGANKFGDGNFVYTNPETGQLTLFDEDGGGRFFGLTLADLTADIGPEIAETVGAIGGGIAGAIGGASAGTLALPGVGTVAGGTAGFIAGEGVGSTVARQAYIRALDFFGETEDSRTGLEVAADMAYTGTMNAAAGPVLSGVWRGAKFVGGKVRIPKDGLNKTNKEVLDAFNAVAKGGDPASEAVANPTVGMVTGNPVANFLEGGLEMMPTSTITMRRATDAVIDQMEKENRRLAMEYGGIRSFDETADSLLKSTQRVRDDYTSKISGMYNDIGARIPNDIVSDGKSTANFINKYIDESKTATGKDFLNKALFQAQKVADDAANGKLTYTRLKQFRSDTMKGIRAAESQGALGPQDANVKKLIGHLTKDLYDLVENASVRMSDPKLLDDYKVINKLVKQNNAIGSDMDFINKVLKKGEADTSAALRYAFSGAKDSGKRIRKLRNQFTPEEFDVLAGYQLGKMGIPNASVAGMPDIEEGMEAAQFIAEKGFDPKTFVKNFNNLSQEAQEAFFAGGKYKDLAPALNNLKTVSDRVAKTINAQANPSGTGKRNAFLFTAAQVLPGMESFGQAIGVGAGAFDFGLSTLAYPYLGAKLMTNSSYVNWLSKAVEIQAFDPMSMGQHIIRLGKIAELNPAIREEIQATMEGMREQTVEPIESHQSSSVRGKAQPLVGPLQNELNFREVSTAEVSDKLMPENTQLAQSLDNFQMPSVGGDAFGATDPVMAASPTILPDERDREIAMRQQGIASLV